MRGNITPGDWKAIPLAAESAAVFRSPDPEQLHVGQPSLAALQSGRLVAAFDLSGPGLRKTPGAKGRLEHFNRWLQGRVAISNDRGKTWAAKHDFPFCNPLLFRDGQALYLVGHDDTTQIIRSADGGETWSKPVAIAPDTPVGDDGSNSPAGVCLAHGNIYMVIMKVTSYAGRGDLSNALAPVILRAAQGVNLANAKSWTASEPGPTFREVMPEDARCEVGVPFFSVPDANRGRDVGGGRWAHRVGWSAAHLVQIADANHYWHDRAGRTLHLLTRGSTHRSNLAVLARVEEDEGGVMRILPQTTPAGARQVLLPLPGGHLKFDLLHDAPSGLFWLLSNQSVDSMTRAERLPPGRHHLPPDELHRLQLHFSRNLVDWCFAGYVSGGAGPKEARTAPCMAVRGTDLALLCCTGDAAARHAQDAPEITYHCIPAFRELVY